MTESDIHAIRCVYVALAYKARRITRDEAFVALRVLHGELLSDADCITIIHTAIELAENLAREILSEGDAP